MNQDIARKPLKVVPRPATPISAFNSGGSKSGRDRVESRILNAKTLFEFLGQANIVLVDVRNIPAEPFECIPGSARLNPDTLYRRDGNAEGLMPNPADLASILSATGIQPGHHVVVYDDETGVDATRLIWLLDAFGHSQCSLLSGGFEAWKRHNYPVTTSHKEITPSLYPVRGYAADVNFDQQQVLDSVDDEDIVILDTRSIAEYNGLDVRAARGGRIPGAINIAWDELIDYYDTGEILGDQEIEKLMLENGIDRGKQIVVYCQSNRRSAHSYVVLNALGYRVSTYAGSWSEWGNDARMPIEIERS